MYNYKDFDWCDIFVIDKNNYKEQKDLFFGYKIIDDNGFWLQVKWINNVLNISSSFVSPIIAIYKYKDYWAISNSIYFLTQYIQQLNMPLTIDKEVSELIDSVWYSVNYIQDKTYYKEITILPNFINIKITDGNIEINEIPNTLQSIDLEDSEHIFRKWYNRYSKFLNQLSNDNSIIKIELSGGRDSRISFVLAYQNNINISEIISYKKKHAYRLSQNTFSSDYVISNNILKKFNKDHLLNIDILTTDKYIDLPIHPCLLFHYGNTNRINSKLTVKEELNSLGKRRIRDKKVYFLTGNASECYSQYNYNNQFLLGWVRRRTINGALTAKYTGDKIIIMPFLDKDLLSVSCNDLNLVQCIIYKKFFPYLLEFPFTNGADDYYYFSEDTLKKADDIIKKWETNKI